MRQAAGKRGKATYTTSWRAARRVGGWLILFFLLAGAEVARAERLPLRPYTTADGLAHDRARCIVRTSDGFLWIGTAEGLSRFDGYRFVNYGLENGLPNATVSAVLETRAGWLWVGTDNGAARLQMNLPQQAVANQPLPENSRPPFTAYRLGTSLLANQVSVLYEDSAGRVWAGTLDGLFLWDEAAQRFEAVQDGLLASATVGHFSSIAEDAHGSLWYGTWKSMLRCWPDGRLVKYDFSGQTVTKGTYWRHVLRTPDGLLCFLDNYGLIAFRPDPSFNPPDTAPFPWRTLTPRYDETPAAYHDFAPGEARFYTSRQAQRLTGALQLRQTADGRFWATTQENGLYALENGRFRRYGPEQGIADNFIVDVTDDRAGNIWVATFRNGVQKWGRNGFTSYSPSDGLQHARVVTLFKGPDDTVCASADEWAVACADAHRVTEARLNVPARANWSYTLNALRDHTGAWWTPASGGLYRFPAVPPAQLAGAQPSVIYTTGNGLPKGSVTELFEDSRGDLWFAAGVATVRWERARDTFHTSSNLGLPVPSRPGAFAEDAGGSVWAGFLSSLARYRDGRWRVWTEADGLPAGAVRDLHFDQAGRLWIATSLGGLARVDNPNADTLSFQTYTTKQGLAGDNVRCIVADKFGRIYLGVGRGVDRLDPLNGRVKHYTTADGLPNSFVNTAFRDDKGDLWFGMLNGLARFTPEMDAPDAPVPVLLSGLRINGVSYLVSDLGLGEVQGPTLASGPNQVQFDFFGLSFAVGEALRYQYKFEGLSADWSAPSEQRTVQASLSPGQYRFLVRAVNADGTAGEPARVALRVLPPIWQRWWFIVLAALVLGGIALTLERYRARRLGELMMLQRTEEALSRSRAERLTEIERVRRRIATDLHDDIGSSLTQISIMSEVLRQRLSSNGAHDNTAAPLDMMAEASRELVDSLSDIVWAINPQKDRLSDLVQRMRRFASDLLTARNIKFRLELPNPSQDVQLGANVRRELFMIFKESLNNLVKHSGCTEADIALESTPDGLQLTIRDNGQGFDTNHEFDGYGLSSMRGRARDLGGALALESAAGQGTTIKLFVPWERAPELRDEG